MASAPQNISSIILTLETSHFSNGWLNEEAPENMPCINLTLETFHFSSDQVPIASITITRLVANGEFFRGIDRLSGIRPIRPAQRTYRLRRYGLRSGLCATRIRPFAARYVLAKDVSRHVSAARIHARPHDFTSRTIHHLRQKHTAYAFTVRAAGSSSRTASTYS